ncbi:MAG: flagellar basal body rod protein FlgB [Eubacteriales bacterium]|jgi:flagellar basal-body rod protein FlgB
MLNNIGAEILIKGLDALWMKQRVISNNIANATTPGYKSKSVEFDNVLKSALNSGGTDKKSLKKAIANAKPELVENDWAEGNEDGNNVVIDTENIELARAQLQYDALITALNAQINRTKYAITGGQ